jgi:hypothetical protein
MPTQADQGVLPTDLPSGSSKHTLNAVKPALLIFIFLTLSLAPLPVFWKLSSSPETDLVSMVKQLEVNLQEEKMKSQNLSQVAQIQNITLQKLIAAVEQPHLVPEGSLQTLTELVGRFKMLKEIFCLLIAVMATFGLSVFPKSVKERLSLFMMNFRGKVSTLAFSVTYEKNEQEIACLINIQCPGVQHEHVEGVLFYNGIAIKITKPAAGGIAALNWTQKFHFPWDEGLFDFKADEARLENGELSLKFKASSPVAQRRVFKFPPHFSMNVPDAVTHWEDAQDDLQHAHNLQTAIIRTLASFGQTEPMACSTVSAPACLCPVGTNSGALLEQMSEVGKAASSEPGVIGQAGKAENEPASVEADHGSSSKRCVSQ